MSASDVDEGVNQRINYDLTTVRIKEDLEYFKWDYETGVVSLNQKLDKPVNYVFELKATATDGGTPPLAATIDITIEVKESFNNRPEFQTGPGWRIELSETYSDYSTPVAKYTATSNIPDDPIIFFLLVTGRTEQTNKGNTFRAMPDPHDQNAVLIFLAKPLEFEKVNKYTLTVQVKNSPDFMSEALLTVKVKDENNQAPVFTNVESGTVLENEPAGTIVMHVSAVDADGTIPNNQVKYSKSRRNPRDVTDLFSIDPHTGVITTNAEFDREERAVYALIIDAKDGNASALLQNGQPNVTPQKFTISIADKNDNPPYFPQQLYNVEVPEDQDIGSMVIEVRALDKDEDATFTVYRIINGNVGQAFDIDRETGFIRVAKQLDNETIKHYSLTVDAYDGQFSNQTTVEISIKNVNDMKPWDTNFLIAILVCLTIIVILIITMAVYMRRRNVLW